MLHVLPPQIEEQRGAKLQTVNGGGETQWQTWKRREIKQSGRLEFYRDVRAVVSSLYKRAWLMN